MALLANQIMDARIFSMNGRAELSQFLKVTNQSIMSQVNSNQDDNRKNRKYPCPLCGKRFRFNSILSLHMRTHTGEKPFKCPYCDHRAAQKGNLKIHLRTHKQGILGKGRGRIREENKLLHELEERAILRDKQTRAGHFNQPQSSNINHLRKPHLSQTVLTQPSFLSTCGAAETQPHTSTSPKMTVITDEPPQPKTTGFRCSFCKGKFRKQQELERHIRILHKPYKCTLCEFAASQEEDLIGHVETTHITADSGAGQKTAVGSGDKRKPTGEFPCEVCGQTFSQAWFLKGHMRKHKDSFEHCCQICGRRFKEPWFLKNHMKVHLNKLAGKRNLPRENDSSEDMNNLTQDHQSNLCSQYISRIHNRFLTAEKADYQDYNQIFATAGLDMKVREMLGRMVSSGSNPLTEAESSPLLGINHLHPSLSSTSMEYLQKVSLNRDAVNSSSSYPGWQIMTPGLPVEQQMFSSNDQQQSSSYLSDKSLPVDDGKACLGDPDSKSISTSGSPSRTSHHGPTDITKEMGDSHCGNSLEPRPQSSSPAAGENFYRCPLSSEYTAAQAASFGFRLDRYHFPHWQSSRDLSSPLQPTSSSLSPNSNPKLRPKSREDWSPLAGHYLGLEAHSENALLMNKQFDLTDEDAGVNDSSSPRTRKSQFEPLDLSVRPESVLSQSANSPPVLVQMSGIFNGLSPSITLQSYSNAASELSVTHAYQCDLSEQGSKDSMTAQNAASTGHDGVLKPDELVQSDADVQDHGEKKQDRAGPWGRTVAESPISSLENLTPGQADQFQHHGSLLSFLRSKGNLSSTHGMAGKSGADGDGDMEKDAVSARKPFQCRYCPYSASQKGNLKTHVLCVHRKPFDNSLYPDRRLRRSHAPQRPSRRPQSITGDSTSGTEQIGMTSLCGT